MSTDGEGSRKSFKKLIFFEPSPSWLWGGFWGLLCGVTWFVGGPWAGVHSVLLGCAGLLMLLCPPVVSLPRSWWVLAAVFTTAGAAAFLPVEWFGIPEWRHHLAVLGVQTGSSVAIQSRQAAESLAMFAMILCTGLWLAGHRASPIQLRHWTLAFALGVAVYAVLARFLQDSPTVATLVPEPRFGFFPNRNHTATYLAMGGICGLGNLLQALRDKRFYAMSFALIAAAVCFWALGAWSMSRGGVVLVVLACLVWLPLLGTRYLGRHGLWVLALIALAVIGLFFIAESKVKERLSKTVESVEQTALFANLPLPGEGKPVMESMNDLDLRIPIAIDTFQLIRDFKWTGIGAGQFLAIFPQYRNLSAVANENDSYHPESDWLWMAAEVGVPATLALAALVVLAFTQSRLAIRCNRDRALRSACLVAAMLVPIHGFFDVPGHRITLAWAAAWLFALSLHSPSADAPSFRPSPWPFRAAGIALLAAALFLANAQWWGGPQPALTAAPTALAAAQTLYQDDLALQQEAAAKGETYQPDPADDRLEKALTLLDQVTPVAPLDRDLLRYRSLLALQFDDKQDRVLQSFALERALDPTWIDGPLRQAAAWGETHPARTRDLWNEALQRASQLDSLNPDKPHFKTQTLQRIRQSAKGKPALEKYLPLAEESAPKTP